MLPLIPLVEGGSIALLKAQLNVAHTLLGAARRLYTPMGVALADKASLAWLRRTANPYLAEIGALAAMLGQPGLFMLNVSYEWGCTSAVAAGGGASRLLRTLDWPLNGLGRNVAVMKTRGPAGEYLSVTWPGFAGVLTAMAPGRFSLAINQAKDWHGRVTRMLEWPLSRLRFLASDALPPAHLARRVCEGAGSYDAAVRLLADTPVCMPAFFTVSGVLPHQGCVIERTPTAARIHPAPAACANHWRFPGLRGAAPSHAMRLDLLSGYMRRSHARHDAMAERMAVAEGFGWLTPPVLCRDTRLACTAEAASGRLAVLGIEHMKPATRILTVEA
jgi:hypothetical protein